MGAGYEGEPAPDPSLRRDLARRAAAARADPTRVLLEGVHALKHALRFGADIELVLTPDLTRLTELLAQLAPDVVVPAGTQELERQEWRDLVPRELPSPALAVARRPTGSAAEVLATAGLVVVLDRPRHLGNLGAVVRVAAAAGATGVLTVGDADPWHPTAVRAAAGLQFAVSVAATDRLPADTGTRTIVALDPNGTDLLGALPSDGLLLVGTERGGLTPDLLDRADQRVRLPMRPGVSSLNLATAVAAALYGAAANGDGRR